MNFHALPTPIWRLGRHKNICGGNTAACCWGNRTKIPCFSTLQWYNCLPTQYGKAGNISPVAYHIPLFSTKWGLCLTSVMLPYVTVSHRLPSSWLTSTVYSNNIKRTATLHGAAKKHKKLRGNHNYLWSFKSPLCTLILFLFLKINFHSNSNIISD